MEIISVLLDGHAWSGTLTDDEEERACEALREAALEEECSRMEDKADAYAEECESRMEYDDF